MRQRAFSLTEILIAVIVVAIVGGALVSAFFSFSLSYSHTEDYTTAREEIENALGALSSQLSNAGLGMPNNRDDKGSFAVAFAKGDNVTVAPVMSLMGKKGEAWGGPITVATDDLPDGAVKTLNSGYYSGSELYYAWAVPRSGLVSPDFGKAMRKPSGLSTGFHNALVSEGLHSAVPDPAGRVELLVQPDAGPYRGNQKHDCHGDASVLDVFGFYDDLFFVVTHLGTASPGFLRRR